MVSVIVPVYNAEDYLRQCLDSILGQTLQDTEILCVDAGSTDGSGRILEDYARKDPRIRIFSGFGRLDAGTARNLGLEQARGEFLSFLDADDYFDPAMLEAAAAAAEREGSDIVIFSARQHNMATGAITPMPWAMKKGNCPRHSPFAPEEMADRLFNSFENWTWNKLFRTRFIREQGICFQSIRRTNDMAFTCEALARARKLTCLDEAYPTYRTGTGTSLQQTNDLSPTCFWEAYLETRRRLEAAGVYETYRRSFLNTVLSGTMFNLRSVKNEASRRAILEKIQGPDSEFPLEQEGKSFYYNRGDYRSYMALRCQAGPSPSRWEKAGDLLYALRECCNDHGLGYTVKYAYQKLFHNL